MTMRTTSGHPTRRAAADFEIYTINTGGGGRVQLTHNTTFDEHPSYSPNGKKIAYAGEDGKDWEIYTINAGGGSRFNVTDNTTDDFEPSWGSRHDDDDNDDDDNDDDDNDDDDK